MVSVRVQHDKIAHPVWLVKSVGAQMQARMPVADSSVGAELKVLFETKNLFIILSASSRLLT